MGNHYRTGRSVVFGKKGMVATSQVSSTLAGLDVLREGGNAVDAAVAAAAVLHVVEPYNTGIGGDMFAQIWWAKTGELKGLNGSGRAPAAATVDALRHLGHCQMPTEHVHAITTPGALDGWVTLLESYGRMDLPRLLSPAIRVAEEGFVVPPVVSQEWDASAKKSLWTPTPPAITSSMAARRAWGRSFGTRPWAVRSGPLLKGAERSSTMGNWARNLCGRSR